MRRIRIAARQYEFTHHGVLLGLAATALEASEEALRYMEWNGQMQPVGSTEGGSTYLQECPCCHGYEPNERFKSRYSQPGHHDGCKLEAALTAISALQEPAPACARCASSLPILSASSFLCDACVVAVAAAAIETIEKAPA